MRSELRQFATGKVSKTLSGWLARLVFDLILEILETDKVECVSSIDDKRGVPERVCYDLTILTDLDLNPV